MNWDAVIIYSLVFILEIIIILVLISTSEKFFKVLYEKPDKQTV